MGANALYYRAELLPEIFFVNKIKCARLFTRSLQFWRVVRGHEYHSRDRKPAGDKPSQGKTIEIWHVNVHQNKIRLKLPYCFNRFAAFAGARNQVDQWVQFKKLASDLQKCR